MAIGFGTDGIRGVANAELSPELVLALGRAAARRLGGSAFLVGRDTRRSGPMLFAALAAGMLAEGLEVIDFGVIPTPGLAYLATRRQLPAAMISASHNPFSDNGIKLLSSSGTKLGEAIEAGIEEELARLLAGVTAAPGGLATGEAIGTIQVDRDGLSEYCAHLRSSVQLTDPARLSVVCDCANGAASMIAPELLRALGLEVLVINAEPDGFNINADCGSTAPEGLAEMVRRSRADLGLGFDGDADRLIAVDANGALIDGDVLLALFAFDLAERGALANEAVAITVMSNLGLRRALAGRGIATIETPVGDRHVLDAMAANGLVLGGEQSGHLVFSNDATTGDGILTALKLLELVSAKNRPLAELSAEAMTRFPQELRSVRVSDRAALQHASTIWREVKIVQADLGDSGRVLVRASGTEEIVRVMVEADQREAAVQIAERLAALIASELGPAS